MPREPLPAATTDAMVIQLVRGERVVLDADLARLFGVETRRLNEQLRRNQARFEGYAFQLSPSEYADLMSQNATSRSGRHGGRRKPPWAFTEHGVVMAATILNSPAAIAAMRLVVEVFVRQRRREEPLPGPAAMGLGPRLQRTIEGLLDSVIDPRTQATVRDEAQALLTQSIQSFKERLSRPGLENEEIAARAAKLLAEAEASRAAAAKTHAEAGEIALRLLARKLRLVIEAERAMVAEDLGRFLSALEDLSQA